MFQEVVALRYSERSVYGYSDWVVGGEKEITGRKWDDSSEAEDAKNSSFERTFKIEGNLLFAAHYENNVPQTTTDRPFKKN